MLAHSNRIVGACPICGTMVALRARRRQDVYAGTCVLCVVEIWADGETVREALEAKGIVPTVDSGLYRVRRIIERLWAFPFPCKGRR